MIMHDFCDSVTVTVANGFSHVQISHASRRC